MLWLLLQHVTERENALKLSKGKTAVGTIDIITLATGNLHPFIAEYPSPRVNWYVYFILMCGESISKKAAGIKHVADNHKRYLCPLEVTILRITNSIPSNVPYGFSCLGKMKNWFARIQNPCCREDFQKFISYQQAKDAIRIFFFTTQSFREQQIQMEFLWCARRDATASMASTAVGREDIWMLP